jgi:hypothetical protein
MTIDGRDGDRRPTPTADGGPRDTDSEREPVRDDGETPSFAALFERAPADVSLDDVVTALRAVRTGEEE